MPVLGTPAHNYFFWRGSSVRRQNHINDYFVSFPLALLLTKLRKGVAQRGALTC